MYKYYTEDSYTKKILFYYVHYFDTLSKMVLYKDDL